MTRDEARAVIRELWKQPKTDNSSADFYVDMFVKFGALDLDPAEDIVEALTAEISNRHARLPLKSKYVRFALEDLGFKLVRE